MLSARKLHLVAGLKVHGLDLRKAELDFYMFRYASVAGISSILVGLSYVGLIKIKIPEELDPEDHGPWIEWPVFAFYVCTSLTMAAALFNFAVVSFLIVNAQGLMLRGPPDSVQRCVDILASYWMTVRVTLAISLAMVLASVVSICWMKLFDSEFANGPAALCTLVVGVVMLGAVVKMTIIYQELAISENAVVHGDLTVASTEEQSLRVDILNEASPTIRVT